MDTSILCPAAIEEELFNRMGRQIPVGLHWRTIQLDKPGRIPDDEVVKALHIEVDREHRNEAKQALEGIYNSTATVFPLHLCLRAVPLLKDVMNSHVKADIKCIIARQASFNNEDFGKKKINSWEIKTLDFKASASGKTLRDMIMEIPQQDVTNLPLFCSVDQLRSKQSTVVFTCMPVVESEAGAQHRLSSLAAYLKHRHGDEASH
jgi:hypothetical protein